MLAIESYLRLLADSPLNLKPGISDKPPKLFRAFFSRLLQGNFRETILSFASLGDQLLKGVEFAPGPSTGAFIPAMRDLPIFREYHHWWKTGDPKCMTYVLSFLFFLKKMEYEDEAMYETALRGWEQVELKLDQLVLDARDLEVMKHLLATSDLELPESAIHPHFGPGHTADGPFGIVEKSSQLFHHSKVDYAFFGGLRTNFGRRGWLGYDRDRVLPDSALWSNCKALTEDIARVKFAWKNIKTARTICMEPNTVMYGQQAVEDRLVRAIHTSPVYSRFVDLHDQGANRHLARYGSLTGKVDTIDLSSASDSVHVELVRGIFPRRILFWQLAMRTSKVRLPDGTVKRVKKFAPMGSALCFPTQTLIFTTAVLYAAILQRGGHPVDSPLPQGAELPDATTVAAWFSRRPSPVNAKLLEPARVYGDDIICDARLTPYVVALLSRLGFSVNTEKSFTGNSLFRESCGGWYWYRHDVTPVLFRVKNMRRKLSSNVVMSMIAGANIAGDAGYVQLRRGYIRHLLYSPLEWVPNRKERNLLRESGHKWKKLPNQIAFSERRDDSYAVYSTAPRNDHLLQRTNADLQRTERWCLMESAYGYRYAQNAAEEAAVEKYLYIVQVTSEPRETEVPRECISSAPSRAAPAGNRLRLGWTPTWE